ncbi:hypothetical protein ABT294_36530 [Nonomuraea sp. NPDC000554]|uniref:hypothetical protein n=1 Tax=Nonomuraea sp. NPDC000554 TaxID=3154259 RepID=UPI00332F7787
MAAPPRALLISGHLVDAPGRPAERFPQRLASRVRDEMSAVLDGWAIGPGTTVITGGARGADIIGAEQGVLRGAHLVLCLALPVKELERRSVELLGTDWLDRFHRLLPRADVRVLPGRAVAGDEVFARANQWMVETARDLDPDPFALVVWDGKEGDGPGGTSDLVRRLGHPMDDPRLRVIDPATLEP